MATYRVLNPKGEVVDTKDIESADDAHAWFVDQKAEDILAAVPSKGRRPTSAQELDTEIQATGQEMPAVTSKSATSFEVMGVRGATFRSCRA